MSDKELASQVNDPVLLLPPHKTRNLQQQRSWQAQPAAFAPPLFPSLPSVKS